MGYGTDGLTFNALRGANEARLPQFKNKHGEPAHTEKDGSDWSPAQWLQALVGEVGEFANIRKKFERGDLSFDEYKVLAAKELADIQGYLDLLAHRALDVDHVVRRYVVTATFQKNGEMHDVPNCGPFHSEETAYRALTEHQPFYPNHVLHVGETNAHHVRHVDRHGIDLGRAMIDKFNEVSLRVGSTVRLDGPDWRYTTPPERIDHA